jgi:HEAT repeat protein
MARLQHILAALICGAFSPIMMAQQPSPIAKLFDGLNNSSTTDKVAQQIIEVAQNDPAARSYVTARLSTMIDNPRTNRVWFNAVRLAGELKASETVPSLIRALNRGQLGRPINTTFATSMQLDDDVVAKALSRIGDPAIPSVSKLLTTGDQKARRRAALILLNIDSPASRKVLLDDLPHEIDPRIRRWIETRLHPH